MAEEKPLGFAGLGFTLAGVSYKVHFRTPEGLKADGVKQSLISTPTDREGEISSESYTV